MVADDPLRRFEFRSDGLAAKEGHIHNATKLHGDYTSESGRRYRYYGRCTSDASNGASGWEVSLFNCDKKFKHDAIHDSKII